jgi:hypothetical protein
VFESYDNARSDRKPRGKYWLDLVLFNI